MTLSEIRACLHDLCPSAFEELAREIHFSRGLLEAFSNGVELSTFQQVYIEKEFLSVLGSDPRQVRIEIKRRNEVYR